MKRFVIRTLLLWCFVLLIVSLASAEDQTTNASLSRYNFNGRGSHWILIPDDVSKYAYLGHYPVTAFVFLDYYNSYNKIDDITVKQLMRGTIGNVFKGTNVILAFSKLKRAMAAVSLQPSIVIILALGAASVMTSELNPSEVPNSSIVSG